MAQQLLLAKKQKADFVSHSVSGQGVCVQVAPDFVERVVQLKEPET